jgi:hypothetical protein
VKFPYLALPTRRPVYHLGGNRVRHRPIVPIRIIQPQLSPPIDGCVDSAADDTLFPVRLAVRLGIDLAGAPQGEVRPVGHGPLAVKYARLTLLVTDGFESCVWDAIVGFADFPLRWPLFGQAGFLQFFDVELRGARQETVLSPNSSFQGQHVIHTPRPP